MGSIHSYIYGYKWHLPKSEFLIPCYFFILIISLLYPIVYLLKGEYLPTHPSYHFSNCLIVITTVLGNFSIVTKRMKQVFPINLYCFYSAIQVVMCVIELTTLVE